MNKRIVGNVIKMTFLFYFFIYHFLNSLDSACVMYRLCLRGAEHLIYPEHIFSTYLFSVTILNVIPFIGKNFPQNKKGLRFDGV